MRSDTSLDRIGVQWNPVVLRLALGLVFVVSGVGKVFAVGPKASGIGGFSGMLADLGVPLATAVAVVIGFTELLGGILLLLGLFTRFVAAALAVVMIGATVLVHLPNGFVASEGGIEYTLVLSLVSIALVLSGPGALALEHALFDDELFVPTSTTSSS